ncbi:hypothetical protein HNR39_003455 [Glaciimonas immobilis]|uniref:Uncharacterized protein n=1 Tax=Glaciimonas immobilis TaxID=728004 RepID=A0A840RWP7_9BURK|nr:hypothetical protein [Glaciimonas immobilis]
MGFMKVTIFTSGLLAVAGTALRKVKVALVTKSERNLLAA